MLTPLIKQLAEAIDKAGMRVVFGLRDQGHLPVIERMLKEGASWELIGKEIHWCPKTAKEYYKREKIRN